MKSAWITGASSGIGRELALQLARAGWLVLASARNGPGLAELAKEAGDDAGRIVACPLDVTVSSAVAAAATAITDAHGAPDLVVLNAGTYIPMSPETFSAVQFRMQLDVNLMGAVNVLEALLPALIARRRGHVVLVASVAGYRGLPTSEAYGATKAALINLAESLKLDLARHDIKVQLVNPGFVATPLTAKNSFKMPFLMPVDRAAARMIAGMASDRFEITFPKRFTWQLKALRLLPYRVYFWLARKITKV
ncbi:MAG: SDR family NAD(P)-dependent oxidoreductase [Alphaproteobacteria bacterium]